LKNKISRRGLIKSSVIASVGLATGLLSATAYEKSNKNMKVLLLNGSPRERGCTFTALSEVASSLERNGIETEIYWLGSEPISGCQGCLFYVFFVKAEANVLLTTM